MIVGAFSGLARTQMINTPVALVHAGFQSAWLDVVRRLASSDWETRNLVVQIQIYGCLR